MFTFVEIVKENIEVAIEKLQATVASQVGAFLLQDSSFILTSNHDENDSSITCGKLPNFIQDSNLVEELKKIQKKSKKVSLRISI